MTSATWHVMLSAQNGHAMERCPRLTSHVITTFDELSALQEDWSRLLRESESNVPTLSPLWLLGWWRVFSNTADRALRTVAIHSGKRLVGLAPLLVRPLRCRVGLRYQCLQTLASGEGKEDEVCSDYIGVIAASGMERAVAEELAAVLLTEEIGPWGELSLPAMNGDSSLPGHLATALSERGVVVRTEASGVSHYIPLPATWDDYLAALPASHRYFVRRAERDVARWAGSSLHVERATSSESLERGMQILKALHAERWEKDGCAGAFASPLFRAFHAAVTPQLLAIGALDLAWMSAHGEPVAAAYSIRWDGRVHFYQSGRSLRVPHGVRPGIALHAQAIRAAIERGDREYDFLPGESRYKADLALAARPIVHLHAARRSVGYFARRMSELAIDQLRAVRHSKPPEGPAETSATLHRALH